MEKYLVLFGRILLGFYPVLAGVDKILKPDMYRAEMVAAGMPFVPFFLAGATSLLIGGGLSIFVGFHARWGALALVAFILPATVLFHSNPADKVQTVMLLKNTSILGGLLLAAYLGSGPISVDSWLEHRSRGVATNPIGVSR